MWNKGYPKERGLYKCKIDGKEETLIHRRCDISGKSYWMKLNGHDVVGFEILWDDKRPTAEELMK